METSDMCLAAFLTYNNFMVENVKDDEVKKGAKVFVFSRKQGQKIEDVVKDFHNRISLVEPKRFFGEIRNLKSMIYH